MKQKISINKIIALAMIVNMIQIVAVAAIFIYKHYTGKPVIYNNSFDGADLFLTIIVLTVLLNCFFMFMYEKLIVQNSKSCNMLSETNSQLEKLNNTLRAQRHDFMNHLQVVYSLIEMDEYSDAKDYIEKIYNDIHKVNKALKTSNPAINALIQAKLIHAEKLGIEMHVDIAAQLKGFKIPSWEFCRVLSNLIDNSMYALKGTDANRKLFIELYEDMKGYWFKVCNNGPAIPDDIIDRVFEAGFTTKGECGEGMGLAITREIVKQYGGNIQVSSSKHLTEFTGYIPKDLKLFR